MSKIQNFLANPHKVAIVIPIYNVEKYLGELSSARNTGIEYLSGDYTFEFESENAGAFRF